MDWLDRMLGRWNPPADPEVELADVHAETNDALNEAKAALRHVNHVLGENERVSSAVRNTVRAMQAEGRR